MAEDPPEPSRADQLSVSTAVFLRRFIDLWLVIALLMVALHLSGLTAIERPYAIYEMLASGVLARVAQRTGHERVARLVIVLALSALVIALPFLINGVRSPAIAAWLILIPLAGWLMGRRLAAGLTLLAIACVSLVFGLEQAGLFTLPIPLRQPLGWWETWVGLLALCGLTIWYLIGAYDLAQRHERELRERLDRANAALAEQLTQRTGQLQESDQSLARVRSDYEKAYPMAMLAAMVPAVTHDLYTPLSNIGLAESGLQARLDELRGKLEGGTLRRSDLDGFVRLVAESLQIIEHANRRASELVGSLKHLSTEQIVQRRSSFAIDRLVEEVVTTLTPTLRKTPVRVVKELEPGLQMDSYPGPLGQVLVNLVQNALLHGLAGRAAGTITLRARALDAQHVVLEVEDDGGGMSEAVQARLFEPFFTTKAGQGGSGIGLAFSRKLVEQTLGGTIRVRSATGEGCCFTIELPRVAPQPAAA